MAQMRGRSENKSCNQRAAHPQIQMRGSGEISCELSNLLAAWNFPGTYIIPTPVIQVYKMHGIGEPEARSRELPLATGASSISATNTRFWATTGSHCSLQSCILLRHVCSLAQCVHAYTHQTHVHVFGHIPIPADCTYIHTHGVKQYLG